MILPDVNVLVFAHRQDAEHHEAYAAWLAALLAGPDDLALTDAVALGFVRVVTNPRIFEEPASGPVALEFIAVLASAPRVRWLPHTTAAWDHLGRLAGSDRAIRGNLVPDAWLAALALAHGARVATADRGFARFPQVEWFDPVVA